LGIAHHLDGGADGRGNPMPPAAPPKRAPLP
jgi:hypothetical protein